MMLHSPTVSGPASPAPPEQPLTQASYAALQQPLQPTYAPHQQPQPPHVYAQAQLAIPTPLLLPTHPPQHRAGESGGHASFSSPPATEAVNSCRLPPFWRSNPDLWFYQIEAAFQVHHVRNDNSRYNLVVAALDQETISEVANVLRTVPPAGKYEALKAAILNRLTDSADRQLHKLRTQLELGDRKPSQLLRQMRALAGDRATDDVIRVTWLDLMPPSTRRLLKILKGTSLEELAEAADELVDNGPAVAVTSPPLSSPRPHSPFASRSSHDSSGNSVHAELAALRQSVAQLVALTRENQKLLRKITPPL